MLLLFLGVLALLGRTEGLVAFLTNATNPLSAWTGPPYTSSCSDATASVDFIANEAPGSTAALRNNMTYSVTQGGWTPTGVNAFLGLTEYTDLSNSPGVIISAWVKVAQATYTGVFYPVMNLGYSDKGGTGLQLYAMVAPQQLFLCVMYNATAPFNRGCNNGGAGARYMAGMPILAWPSPKSTTQWVHLTWAASIVNAVSVYQLYMNGEVVLMQNTAAGPLGLPYFATAYAPTSTRRAPIGFAFGSTTPGA